ncbi:MAG: F0F1 ATP synthase subunit A [Bacteroidales bacterium]|nr:F0F1 ATP synthase subunit A [Bacteroidales bacterium]
MLKRKVLLFSVFLCILYSLSLKVSGKSIPDNNTEDPHSGNKESKRFNPNEFLFDHIRDAHEWHVFSYKGKHYSIPLPVILVSRNNGLVFFLSNKLHHGHSSYFSRGYEYKLEPEGENKGKISEIHEGKIIGFPVDISITKNILSMFVSVVIILWLFISIANAYKRRPGKPPRGTQSLFEPIILFVRDEIAKQSIGPNHEKFVPYLLTVFFFIWLNNMFGLIPIPPGGANLTGNIAVTGVLALYTMIVVNFSGNKNYWKHIFNTPGVPIWLKIPPVMPVIELFGVITKPVVLCIRLFANITAGHLITLGFLSLIFVFGELNTAVGFMVSPLSIIFLLFMMFLELLVAFIQAFVFTFLSALYIGMAVEEHH